MKEHREPQSAQIRLPQPVLQLCAFCGNNRGFLKATNETPPECVTWLANTSGERQALLSKGEILLTTWVRCRRYYSLRYNFPPLARRVESRKVHCFPYLKHI